MKSVVWFLLLALVSVCALYYTGYAAIQLYRYSLLQTRVEIKDIRWSIRAFDIDALSPQSDYHFDYEDKIYSGQTVWSERYLNQWAATEAIHHMHPKTVWINPSDPAQSTMEKLFPLKTTTYMVLLWAILAYFIILGRKIYNGPYRS